MLPFLTYVSDRGGMSFTTQKQQGYPLCVFQGTSCGENGFMNHYVDVHKVRNVGSELETGVVPHATLPFEESTASQTR